MDPRRSARSLQSCIGTALFIAATAAQAETLVVTDSLHPVSNSSGARLIELDKPAHLTDELSANLPADPRRAAAAAKQRLSSQEGRRITAELRQAYQDVADAWGLKVRKIPAVVVDRTYVVYGISDVAMAEAMIREHLQGSR